MPMNFGPQQEQEHFPFLTELESQVHPLTKWCLAGMGAVGGYFWGISHDRFPVVVWIALGLVVGLLFVGILKHFTTFLLGVLIVFGLAVGTFFLLQNDAAMKGHKAAPAAPVRATWLDGLMKEARP